MIIETDITNSNGQQRAKMLRECDIFIVYSSKLNVAYALDKRKEKESYGNLLMKSGVLNNAMTIKEVAKIMAQTLSNELGHLKIMMLEDDGITEKVMLVEKEAYYLKSQIIGYK